MTKAVFFDVGNTLIFADPPVPQVFTRVANRMGHPVSLEEVEPFMTEVDAYYQSEYMKDGDFWCVHDQAVQIWLDMYAMMADHCGITRDVPQLVKAVYDEYLLPQNWSAFPDVRACLSELKRRGYALGIVSNWDATLEELFRRMDLLPYFDEVVASAAVGCRKPNPAIFEIALERMNLSAEETVHVGDLVEADGMGATSAGITPVIIDRKAAIEKCPYTKINTLTDLIDAL